jgi:hypothetical protein
MVRIVRTVDGPVEVDPTGKKAGRGAYLCRRRECWQTALRRGALNRGLKTELSMADKQALTEFSEALSEVDDQPSALQLAGEHPPSGSAADGATVAPRALTADRSTGRGY